MQCMKRPAGLYGLRNQDRNTRMRNAVTDTDLATGEGRKKVCPDLAITELSECHAECLLRLVTISIL
jgi:hypothetical protein